MEKKPKIILQTLNPGKIGGTSSLFHAQLSDGLSTKYNFVPLVLDKTVPGFNDFIRLIKLFKEEKPDLVEVQGANIEVLPVIIAARLAGKKVLMSVHGLYSDLCALNLFKRMICKYVTEPLSFYLADGVYTVCEYASKRKRIIRFSRNLMGVVYNPAPDYSTHDKMQNKDEIRSGLGISPDDKVALYIGRITYDKGATFLTNALLELSVHWPEGLKVIIVGDGPMKSQMEKKLQGLINLNQIFFTGIRRDVNKYYNASDFLISPSVHENHSMTILEACASGIPTLATRTGGTPEIVMHNRNGLLVESLSHHELAVGIRRMLENQRLWEAWGRNALNIAQTIFTSQQHNSQLNSIYSRLLNS